MEVVFTIEASKQASELPLPIRRRVLVLVERLAHWPEVSGVRPLRGELAGKYRLRTGDYRLQFSLDGPRIVIEKVGHRDGFYEG
jgi:mRNA-degrading endonuclease RelE of RelBE toxin-antitoxin system